MGPESRSSDGGGFAYQQSAADLVTDTGDAFVALALGQPEDDLLEGAYSLTPHYQIYAWGGEILRPYGRVVSAHHCEHVRSPGLDPFAEGLDRVHVYRVARDAHHLGLERGEGPIKIWVEPQVHDADVVIGNHPGRQVFQREGLEDGDVVTTYGGRRLSGLQEQDVHGHISALVGHACG